MKANIRKYIFYITFMLVFILFITVTLAANPIITSIYTANPDCLVANNTFYIYCNRDEATSNQQAYVMREWHILASTDMRHWSDLGAKMSLNTFKWANANAWTGSICYKNNKYWWYVSVQDAATGKMAIGVASSPNPTGPFADALGKPLINNGTPTCANQYVIDPGVFVDSDGQAYIYWGGYWDLRCAKLNTDMVSLNGTPLVPTGVKNYWEAPTLRKYNNLYYLSYAAGANPATIDYCTSANPMGPWTYRGRLNNITNSPTNHSSYAQLGGRWFFVYQNAGAPGGGEYRRSICVDEMFFNADGALKTVNQTSNGPAPVWK